MYQAFGRAYSNGGCDKNQPPDLLRWGHRFEKENTNTGVIWPKKKLSQSHNVVIQQFLT